MVLMKGVVYMIKSKTAQLIFQTVYCTIGFVGIIASLGVYDDVSHLHWDLYVHFTNLSNFFCIAIMTLELIQTAKKKADSYVSSTPALKFIGMLGILLTFLVFNIMLAGAEGRDPQANWRVGSLAFHVVLPIMYILDWFLFYERKKTKWFYPLVSTSFPLAYVLFIFIQAMILKFNSDILIPGTQTPLIYPYFFLNIDTQGVSGVLTWILILLVAFIVMGYLFVGLDKLFGKKAKADSITDSVGTDI